MHEIAHEAAQSSLLIDMLERGDIDPCVATEWNLDEVPAAVEGLAHGAMPGKQVIVVSQR